MTSENISANTFIVKVTSFVLFAVFVFFYVSSYQSDVLFVAQEYIAKGKTTFHPYVAGVVMTLLLYGLHKLIQLVFRFKGNVLVLSYLPSFLVLILIIDICSSRAQHSTCWHLIFTIPLVTILTFMLFKMVLKYANKEKTEYSISIFTRELWMNMLILLAMMCIVLLCSANNNNVRSNMSHDAYFIKQQHEAERQAILKAEQDSLRQIFIADSIVAAKDSIKREKLRRDSLAESEKNRIGG